MRIGTKPSGYYGVRELVGTAYLVGMERQRRPEQARSRETVSFHGVIPKCSDPSERFGLEDTTHFTPFVATPSLATEPSGRCVQ